MRQDAIEDAARFLWAAWQERRLVEALPENLRPRDVEEGYAIQDALAELAGPSIGWKIAATSKDGQKHIGVDEPLGARLFQRFAHGDGAALPAGSLHMRVAEAEFAYRMGRGLPPRGRPYTMDEVMAAVDTLHLAIEVPDSRYRDYANVGAPQIVAEDACACFFVLGPEAKGWRAVDLSKHAVSLYKNGAVAGTGSGANVLGDPRLALAWLANDRAKRGAGLKAGEVITTGTCVKPAGIAPGDKVTADFGALGQVSASFTV